MSCSRKKKNHKTNCKEGHFREYFKLEIKELRVIVKNHSWLNTFAIKKQRVSPK